MWRAGSSKAFSSAGWARPIRVRRNRRIGSKEADDRRSHGTRLQFAQAAQSLVAAGVLLLSVAGPALAQDEGSSPGENDQVVLTGQLFVEADQTVNTAVIFNGHAAIEGTVREDLFVAERRYRDLGHGER